MAKKNLMKSQGKTSVKNMPKVPKVPRKVVR
jgi:hypothetical protein